MPGRVRPAGGWRWQPERPRPRRPSRPLVVLARHHQTPDRGSARVGQGRRQDALAVVLQSVDGMAHSALEAPQSPNAVDPRAVLGALLAARPCADLPATAFAERRGHPVNIGEAGLAQPLAVMATLHTGA